MVLTLKLTLIFGHQKQQVDTQDSDLTALNAKIYEKIVVSLQK